MKKTLLIWLLAFCITFEYSFTEAGVSIARSNTPGPAGKDFQLTGSPDNRDPVVATVSGRLIHLSDVGAEIREMPAPLREQDYPELYEMALHRLIEHGALVVRALQMGIENDPAVQHRLLVASDSELADAYLQQATADQVTEQVLLDRYKKEVMGKPGPEEVHAWAILVRTEAEGEKVIAKLRAGVNFEALARELSIDPTSVEGGNLGFVTRAELGPEARAVLFSLSPNTVTAYPVQTPYGWAVLKAGVHRTAPTPSYAAIHDQLEVECEREAAARVIREALQAATIREFNLNGSPQNLSTKGQAPSGSN